MAQKPTVTIDDVAELLRDDRLRSYRIDIETDQMIEADENAEKQRRIELTTAMGQMVSQAAPILTSPMGATLAPMIEQTVLFAVRGFKVGRNMEEVIESAFSALVEQISKPQQPQEDPAAKAKAEAEMQKALVEQKRVQIEEAEAAARMRLNDEKHRFEIERAAREAERADAEVMLKAKQHELSERTQRDDIDARRAEQNLRVRQTENGGQEIVSAMDYRDDEMRLVMAQMAQAMGQISAGMAQMAQAQNTPKQVIRDENGRVIGVEPVQPSMPPELPPPL